MLTRDLIAEFLAYNERHRSPATVRFYRQRLKRFGEKFGDREFSREAIRPLEIDTYLHDAGRGSDGREFSDSTKRHNIVAIDSLQSFAVKIAKVLPKDARVFDELEKPRMGQRETIPSDEELEKIRKVASPAFLAIFDALLQSGCRPGELCKAVVADVDWTKRAIVLTEHKTARKTGKPRIIPLGQKLGAMVAAAIAGRTWGPVFRNSRGRAWSPAALSAQFRRYRDDLKLRPDLCMYLCRHRFGTLLASKKKDIKTIADMMGHANVSTTQKYIHRDPAELGADQDDL